MDTWTANNQHIKRIACRKLASETLTLNLVALYVLKTSGLYATVRVLDRDTRKTHDVTVYAREL